MGTVVTSYRDVQTLEVPGLPTLANGASVQSPGVPVTDVIDYLVRVTVTTAAGAAAKGTVSVAIRESIDATDYDDASNEQVIGTIVLPVAGAQTRSTTFALVNGSLIPPNWVLSFRNACGDALTAASVRFLGVSRKPDAPRTSAFSLGFSTGWA